MGRTRFRKLIPIAVVSTLLGCASALKEPRTLIELAGSVVAERPALDNPGAEALWQARQPAGVRQAAGHWLFEASAPEAGYRPFAEAVRALAWLADRGEDPKRRARDATRAVQAAQWCGRRLPDDRRCDYWLGAALGVQVQERRTTALDALPRIVELFERAAAEVPDLEQAAPERALALLYVRAPGWPTGPGDPDLGLQYARQAVEREPDYPPNQLALAEALQAVEDPDGAREAYRRVRELVRAAVTPDPEAEKWLEAAESGLGGP